MKFDPELHLYSERGRAIPSVTQILKAEGWIDDTFYTETGRRRGEDVHRASALLDQECLDWTTVSPIVQQYLETWEDAKASLGLRILRIEHPLHHGLEWACTPDREGLWKGEPAIIELKTGGKERWHKLQVAASGATYRKEPRPQLLLIYFPTPKRWKLQAISRDEATQLYHAWDAIVKAHHWRRSWKG